MDLKTKDGMTVVSESELNRLHNLKHLFKRYRDTVAMTFKNTQEKKPIDNLLSKLWRLSDEIIAELNHIGKP